MQDLADLFVKKCKDLACEPIPTLLEDLRGAQESLSALEVNGNSKRMFNNRASYMQVIALCESLYEDTHIKHLDLSYNHLNDMAAQALARLIKVNRTLTSLDLRGNSISEVGAQHLATAASEPGCSLQSLVLAGNPLGDAGVVALGAMLRSNSSLTSLDINDTQAGISGVISVCTALSESNSSLQALDFGRPLFNSGPQDTTTLSIAQMLASNTTLSLLSLSKHSLTDSNLDTLVTYGLLRNSTLQSLDLRANKLSPFAGPTLERLMNECRQLSSLDLSSNQLGDAGALSVARSLPYSQGLKKLDLRSNGIGEQGLIAIAEALSLASQLQCLLVWGNNFGPSASKAFLDTLSAIGPGSLTVDIQPYMVDEGAQVALLEV